MQETPPLADIFGRFSTIKQLQTIELEHNHWRSQILFATLTQNDETKPAHFLFEYQTVLPSQKVDCFPMLVDFGLDQFFIRKNDEGKI